MELKIKILAISYGVVPEIWKVRHSSEKLHVMPPSFITSCNLFDVIDSKAEKDKH